MVKQKKKEV